MKNTVHISNNAITQILLNGFEAFVIKHGQKKRHAIEMHASIYGDLEEDKKTRNHKVDFISVDTSAEMSGGYVAPQEESSYLKKCISSAVGFKQLGAMHVHPYLLSEMSLNEVRRTGCDYSDGDKAYFQRILSEQDASSPFHLELLLTIKQIQRNNTQSDGWLNGQENVFEFAVGNCKCFLRAQVFSLDQKESLLFEPTRIECEYLESFKNVTTDFGRFEIREGKKRIVEFKPSSNIL